MKLLVGLGLLVFLLLPNIAAAEGGTGRITALEQAAGQVTLQVSCPIGATAAGLALVAAGQPLPA